MGRRDQADQLAVALDELSDLGSSPDREAIAGLRDRLASGRLRVLVAGEAKRGKSTLVNALLGRPVLPAGVLPLTALATTVRYGSPEAVTATFADGRVETLAVSALESLVTERGNPGNRLGLTSVTVLTDSALLASGVELVDTPGTGSVYGHNTLEAESALATIDAAIFVLTADPPVSGDERELIARVASLSAEMFVVLNKADRLSGPELAEVLAFTAQVVNDAAKRVIRICPLSAQSALDHLRDDPDGPDDPAFAEFEREFAAYLDHAGAADLRKSVHGHARRMANSLKDEVVLARRAADMRGSEASQRVQAFAARLAAVRDRRREAAILADAESARMLAELNDSAEQAGRERAHRVARLLMEVLDGPLRMSTAAEIERGGRARLTDLAVSEAEDWRNEWTAALESELSRLDGRLTDVLRAELESVRQAAATLLGLELTVAAPARRLAPDLRFFYQVGEQAGQTELLAGAIRRHVPGETGRRRAREHVRSEVFALVPQQIGRARADLQYRLAEATRRLVRSVDERYAAGTGRLESALAEADELRGATAAEVETRELALAHRLDAIERVLACWTRTWQTAS